MGLCDGPPRTKFESCIMTLRAWTYLLLLSLFWGASFYFIEVGLQHLSVFWLVSLRLVTGAVCLFTWLVVAAISLPGGRMFWQNCLVMGVLNNLAPFCLIAWGQLSVTGGMASILNANTAFIGVLTSAFFLKTEPLRLNRVVGVLIGVSGVAVAIGVDPLSDQTGSVIGQLAIILATLFYALAGVWGRVKLSSYPAVQGACGMLICSAALSVPLAFSYPEHRLPVCLVRTSWPPFCFFVLALACWGRRWPIRFISKCWNWLAHQIFFW